MKRILKQVTAELLTALMLFSFFIPRTFAMGDREPPGLENEDSLLSTLSEESGENGDTGNILATNPEDAVPDNVIPTQNHTVNFYIFIDEERTLLETRNVTSYKIWDPTAWSSDGGGNWRYYLMAETLEDVYGNFGFEASDLVANTKYFPNATQNEAKIWADSAVQVIDGHAYSALGLQVQNMDVYYLPKQTLTASNGQWTNFKTTESFYSVKVQDPNGLVYSDLPEATYTLNGQTATSTVLNIPVTAEDKFVWRCIGKTRGDLIDGTVNPNGTITFSIPNISEPYIIEASLKDGTKQVFYNINRSQTPVDAEYECPTIQGSDTYIENIAVGTETYTVLEPTLTSYFYLIYKDEITQYKHIGESTFIGWAVNGDTDELLQPGTVLNLSEYPDTISLVAQWHSKHASAQVKTGSMVNFYVSLAAHPLGESTEWSGDILQERFTNSVYTDDCGVDAGIIVEKQLYDSHHTEEGANQYFVLGGTSGTDISDSHNQILSELYAGYTLTSPVDNQDYTFQLTFPSDEEVMRKIRQLINQGENQVHIIINGKEISADEMTTENFSVRWYVFKYDVTDGWHIDGVLVTKPSTLRVTKTFTGDAQAIQAVKQNYSIDVTLESGQVGAAYPHKTLTLENADNTESDNTYVWNVPIDQYYRYIVTENNYLYTEDRTTTTAQYEIRNAKDNSQNTAGWQLYTAAVPVTGQKSHMNEFPLTINLLNTYTKPGVLTLHKIDSVTERGMSNLEFDVKDANNNAVTLYHTGGNHYTMIPSSEAQASTSVITDANGQVFITLNEGQYHLIERVPAGYDDPGAINITMAMEDGTVVLTDVTATKEGVVSRVDNTQILTLRNRSETTNLTVKKLWSDGAIQKPVTIQLYRNDEAVIGSSVTLNGTESPETWTYVFQNVPLYVDGAPARYTIREEQIGDFCYSANYFGDGYRYYTVEYSPLTYLDEHGQPVADIAQAATMELSVENGQDTNSLSIYKVDEYGNPLPGGVFKLYTAGKHVTGEPIIDSDAVPLKTRTSDTNGVINFGSVNKREYYLLEYEAPEGYENSNAIFRLKSENGVINMERWDSASESWTVVSNNSVVNKHLKTNITITKKVTGDLNGHDNLFEFSLTCTEPMAEGSDYILSYDHKTATFSLNHGQSITINEVPVGAKITITETNAKGYNESILIDNVEVSNPIDVFENMAITVNNQKDTIPDEGILLDISPYILILAGVIIGATFLLVRKHHKQDDD